MIVVAARKLTSILLEEDLDDGISLTKDGNIYHLGVHIADVSNYVQGGSALDREALRRGTSVYLVDGTGFRIPDLLPAALSESSRLYKDEMPPDNHSPPV